jgi:hypothetical protein
MKPSMLWMERALQLLLWGLLTLGAWQLLHLGEVLTHFPYQVETREGATVRTAIALEEGRDPWAPGNIVQDGNVHGLLEPLLAAELLGDHVGRVEWHRGYALLVLSAGAFLIFLVLREFKHDALGATAGAMAWAGANVFFIGATARNDALAAFLFLAPLALWLLRGPSWTLALAALLAALAVLAKLYAPLGGVLMILGLWIEGRRRTAAWVSAIFLAFLVIFGSAVNHAFPLYWQAMAINLGDAVAEPSYLWEQSKAYLLHMAWPLFALYLWRLWSGSRAFPLARALNTQTALVILLLSCWLGLNKGAWLQYYTQLLEPLLILAIAYPPLTGWRSELRKGALVAAAALAISWSCVPLKRFGPFTDSCWSGIPTNIAKTRLPLLPAVFTTMLTQQGQEVFDGGHADVFARSDAAPPLSRAYAASIELWRQRLKSGQVDLVLFPENGISPFAAYLGLYHQTGNLCFPVPMDQPSGVECYQVYLRKVPGKAAEAKM